ncbi:hypothetical protein [Stutzerimonas stutzeri]|uniref:DUF7696 family protein n=1 Tax=Stutzerimonas TaxID=2901164 RepID=UPI0018D6FC15|nr:hypothetical protein [Stutzerimonas stutzeri]MBH3356267.1 hypothetical protein [Stutzerimonas stutzeri]QUE75810.1 hypothetical protein KCX70_21755 [Stutzerimonas stutzeri]
MPEQDSSQLRLECEARTWLRKGYTTAERITELTALIAKHRGTAGAAKLIEEMRRQWACRSEWLGGQHG